MKNGVNMAIVKLDLRAPEYLLLFDKGKTLDPIFFYYAPDFSVINLTGWTARMQARATIDGSTVLTGFDLTTENDGLAIVTGDCELEKEEITIVDCYGVQLNVSATVTAAIAWTTAYFDLELVTPSGKVLPFVKGTLQAENEVTR